MSNIEKLNKILDGAAECHSVAELNDLINSGKQPVVKLGIDPTSPNLHLGHAVVLRKLRQMQDVGFRIILIIGDFTAQIGDPSGRTNSRPSLSKEEIEANAKTYLEQAGKILDLSRDSTQASVVHNGEWFNDYSMADLIQLAGKFTVAQILERNDFSKRLENHQPIGMNELLYPMLQALDSVEIHADIEIGGTDQTFNIMAGRTLMRSLGMKPQICLTMPILSGCGTKEKMSKSLNNTIGITESPEQMFGKVMSITDDQIREWFNLLTDVQSITVESMMDNPASAKRMLGRKIVEQFYGSNASTAAEEHFDWVVKDKQTPHSMQEFVFDQHDKPLRLIDCLPLIGLAKSKSDARRLIQGGGVRVDNVKIDDVLMKMNDGQTYVINKGAHSWAKVIFE